MASGQSIEVRAVVVIETEGGTITRSTHYIDVAGRMAQLGAERRLAPDPGFIPFSLPSNARPLLRYPILRAVA